jgi:hypothetical protein
MSGGNATTRSRLCTPIALCLVCAKATQAVAQPQETLVAIEHGAGPLQLYYLDSSTGAVQQTFDIQGTTGAHTFMGMSYGDGRLWGVRLGQAGVAPEELVSMHLADWSWMQHGPIPPNWGALVHPYSTGFDPTSGVLYTIINISWGPAELHSVDKVTGQGTFVTAMTGSLGAEGLAIDANGIAYTMGWNSSGGRALFSFDLQSGQMQLLGSFGLPAGSYWDMAFDSSGALWFTFDAPPQPAQQQLLWEGLYKADINSLQAQRMQAVIPTYYGLEFIPAPPPPVAYCSAKTNSLGCVPSISSSGWPSSTASSGFVVSSEQVRNQTSGLAFFSAQGRAWLPFQGGILCMKGPWRRTPLVTSSGSSPPVQDCTGVWSTDLNARLASHAPLPGGTVLQVQWYGRDPGSPRPVSLSDALEVTLQP